jgi:DNA-binding MarR family transcriptional regulator
MPVCEVIWSVMTDKPSAHHQKPDETKRLLARVPVRTACELDVLVFLQRHPRSLLTIEQLAAFVGYDMKEVAKVVDAFISSGLLERTQNPNHAARMYRLVLDGPQGGGLAELLRLVSTRQGRREVLQLLPSRHSQTKSQAGPVDISQEKAKRRLYATI